MLERIMAVLGQAVQFGGLLKDIERGMDGTVADDVDTHGVAALRSRQNQLRMRSAGTVKRPDRPGSADWYRAR